MTSTFQSCYIIKERNFILNNVGTLLALIQFKRILKSHSQVRDNFWQLKSFNSDEKRFLFHSGYLSFCLNFLVM